MKAILAKACPYMLILPASTPKAVLALLMSGFDFPAARMELGTLPVTMHFPIHTDMVQVKEYILQLEAHLAETHRQAQRLIRKQTELGASLGDFGSSLLGLGKFEQPPLADQFLSMGEKSAVLARHSQVRLSYPPRSVLFPPLQ